MAAAMTTWFSLANSVLSRCLRFVQTRDAYCVHLLLQYSLML